MKALFFMVSSIVVIFCHISFASATSIISTFNIDDEGWSSIGMVNVSHENNGGNQGGFLSLEEAGGDTFASIAPAKFLGDLSQFDKGIISFDSVMIEPYGSSFTFGAGFGRITIIGGGSHAILDIAPNDPEDYFSWTTYSANMNASDWGRTQDQWMNILSSVTEIRVITEAIVGYEIVGFDNFKLQSSPVPEPTTILLLGSGLAGIVGVRKRKMHR